MRIESLARPFRWLLDQTVSLVARARVPASILTLSSFVLCLAAGFLFGAGRFMTAGLFIIPAAACDLVARPLAHRQPKLDLAGAYLKSVLHRYADLALFLGLLVYYSTVHRFGWALVTGIAMAGAVLVSYSQARAESLIERCRVGFWERPERIALMILGALSGRMPIALLILAVGSNITVIHRIWHTWQETEGRRRAAERQTAPESELHQKPDFRDILARGARRGA
jgi:CDP-diacylglycerol---glycerol-3-phosphate 3-phosphatidyltransferase